MIQLMPSEKGNFNVNSCVHADCAQNMFVFFFNSQKQISNYRLARPVITILPSVADMYMFLVC